MNNLLQSARYALRQLYRNPVFTVAAVLTLALGIGATAAIFTIVRGVILEPLPYPEPDRLVRLTSSVPGVGAGVEWNLSTAQYFHFRENSTSLEEIGLWQITALTTKMDGQTRRAVTAMVTADMISLLGARTVHGRLLGEHDDAPDAAPVAMLSYEYWQREFAGDATVVGRSMEVQGEVLDIVGVMAPATRLPGAPGAPRLIEAHRKYKRPFC